MELPTLAGRIERSVNCGSCRECCKGHIAIIAATDFGDDISAYDLPEDAPGMKIFPQKPNGDCKFLDEFVGCTIYEMRPAMCRKFDCVDAVKKMDKEMVSPKIRYAARRLLKNGIGSASA